MKKIIFILLFFTSCTATKHVATNTAIPRPTHIQPDSCLTDKQLKTYLKFVKDSMKIENQRTKIEYKYIRDTIRIVEKAKVKNVKQEEKTARIETKEEGKTDRVVVKEEGKTDRTEVRQENKTERAKLNRWMLFFIGLGIGILIPIIFKEIKKQTYISRLF